MKKILIIVLCVALTLACTAVPLMEELLTKETPAAEPSKEPTAAPTVEPSKEPGATPTAEASVEPTPAESETPEAEQAEGYTEVEIGEISFEIGNNYKYTVDVPNGSVLFWLKPQVAYGSVAILDKPDTGESDDVHLDRLLTGIFSGDKKLQKEDITVAGVPAKMGQGPQTYSGETMQTIKVLFFGEENTTYMFLFFLADDAAKSEYTAVFMKMLDTVKFID